MTLIPLYLLLGSFMLLLAFAMKRFGVPPPLDRRWVRTCFAATMIAYLTWHNFFR